MTNVIVCDEIPKLRKTLEPVQWLSPQNTENISERLKPPPLPLLKEKTKPGSPNTSYRTSCNVNTFFFFKCSERNKLIFADLYLFVHSDSYRPIQIPPVLIEQSSLVSQFNPVTDVGMPLTSLWNAVTRGIYRFSRTNGLQSNSALFNQVLFRSVNEGVNL